MTSASWAQQKFAKVLLDPARAGAEGIVDQLSALGAKRVVYVSCNPATLARDSQSLLSQGFRLEKLGMLDMFPHTSHLESMALFVKKG
ncbi:23S rRNA (uracil-5-)-methyltransferase RumA (23S rRNA(M-5-U1939)-methyltransferase) [Vibrio cholerae B33]|nr:23S rRNA (uracil-5-)-methyltransferase RumA (23S rRNA(M-5-U1939)-methyltransferase) [Vibrio cholerae B33]